MEKVRRKFRWSDDAEPHKGRAKALIQKHPEIRGLIGRNPYTFLIILLCVAMQVMGAVLLRNASWWWIFCVAYLPGAFACHTLFVAIHECSHNLIFKSRILNTIAGIIANLPLIIPGAVAFQRYHIKHHSFLGIAALDANVPYEWEARLVDNNTVMKALWLLFYPIFQTLRIYRLRKEIDLFEAWTIANWVVEFCFIGAVYYFLGGKALVFMTASFFFSIGLHPLGARWIQEHYLTDGEEQETKSYYGPLNPVNLNVGYHNEHHDFPSVPWNKLPQIKKIGGHHYGSLRFHKSYTALLLRFLFDKKMSVYSLTIREKRSYKFRMMPHSSETGIESEVLDYVPARFEVDTLE